MDIVVNSESVSRLHAELVISERGNQRGGHREYTVVDRDSTNGTRVFRHGQWRRIREVVVAPDDRMRFGDYETTPRTLEKIALRTDQAQGRISHPLAGGVEHRERTSGVNRGEDMPVSVAVRRNSDGEVVPSNRAQRPRR